VAPWSLLATVCCNFSVSCPQALFFWHVNSITKEHTFHADNAFFYFNLQVCDFPIRRRTVELRSFIGLQIVTARVGSLASYHLPKMAKSNLFLPALIACILALESFHVPGFVPCRPAQDFVLRNGVRFPRVTFGTGGLPPGDAHVSAVKIALKAGFRSLDTAQLERAYDEISTGRGLRESAVPRADVFLTTKVHP
jgi:hypothetical protein